MYSIVNGKHSIVVMLLGGIRSSLTYRAWLG